MAKFPGHYTPEQKKELEAWGCTVKYYAKKDITVVCEKINRMSKPRTLSQKAHQNTMKAAIAEAQRLKANGELPHYEDRTKKSDFHEFVSRYFKEHHPM